MHCPFYRTRIGRYVWDLLSMATTFYFPQAVSADVTPPAPVESTTWEHVNTMSLGSTICKLLTTADSSTLTTTAYAPDAADHLTNNDSCHRQYVSGPLAAQTISGNITGQFQCLEQFNNCNLFLSMKVLVCSNDGSSTVATLLAITRSTASEAGTTLANRTFPSTALSSYACAKGDRLVVEIGLGGNITSGTAGTIGHNGSLRFGCNASSGDLPVNNTQTGTTYRPWIQFSNDVATINEATTNETVEVELTDTSAALAFTTAADSLAALLTEATSLSYNRPALTAILTQWMGHEMSGRRYTSFAGRTEGATTIDTSDTLSTGLTDTMQSLLATLAREETIGPLLTEDQILNILMSREDSATIGLAELGVIAATMASSDVLAMLLTENSAMLALLPYEDVVTLSLLEDRTILATLIRDELLGPLLSEDQILQVLLTREDAHQLGLSELGAIAATVAANDTLAAALAEDATLLTRATHEELLALGMADASTLRGILNRDETHIIGLTEDRVLLALLAREDLLALGLTELAMIAVALATNDAAVIGLTESATLAAALSATDGLIIGLSDDRALFVRVDREEAVALGMSEDAAILARITTNDAPAIIILDTSQLDITEDGGLVSKTTSDSVIVGVMDAFLDLLVRVQTDETLVLNWTEETRLLALVSQSEDLALPIVETSSAIVAVNSAGDVLTISLTDSSRAAIQVTGEDAVAAILAESATLFAALSADDAPALIMEDALGVILATLAREETSAILILDASALQVPVSGADAVAIQLTESGSAIEVFLNRLGSVLIATVRTFSPVLTVRAIVRAVRYLGSLYTVRVL